jgi:hypothetical protein
MLMHLNYTQKVEKKLIDKCLLIMALMTWAQIREAEHS